jgi:ubiquinone biosynthesis protein COQ4
MLAPAKPFLDPGRPRPKFQPLRALGHFRKLIADKEDTAQVFLMGECLPSKKFRDAAQDFCGSDEGRRLQAEEAWLPSILDDHAALLKLPEGSVAHAYVAFMRKEGLTAQGLVEESERPFKGCREYDDQFQWFNNRLRDTHDLVHVLTGYGRDALGEQCALGFSSNQYFSLTDTFLAWAGAFEIWRSVKAKAPLFKAVAQSRASGTVAARIFAEDIRALLAEPLDAARARLGIKEPSAYRAAHAAWRAQGIDPYTFLAAK